MDKKSLRKEFLAKRAALPADLKKEYDEKICEHIMGMSQFKSAKTIAAYSAIGSEADLSLIISESGKQIALPVCTEGNTLVFKLTGDETTLEKGYFGILEPKPEQPVIALEDIDLMLVPGTVFDRSGNRIGYGKGYYDRVMAQCKCKTIGVAYALQIAGHIETEPHDIKVDLIVTEEGIHKCTDGECI